jgi:hypothetical protein
LSEVSQVQKIKGFMFSLFCGTQIQYIYINMYPKVGREEKKKERKIVTAEEVDHICSGTRHKETH